MSLRSSGLRPLLLKSRISRLFGASPFAQQVIILSRVVAFQAIECVIRRLDSGDANLLFDYGESFAAFSKRLNVSAGTGCFLANAIAISVSQPSCFP